MVSFALVTALFGYGTMACTGNTSSDDDLGDVEAALEREPTAFANPSSDEVSAKVGVKNRIGFGPAKGAAAPLQADDRKLAPGAPGSPAKEAHFKNERSPLDVGDRKVAPGAPGSDEAVVDVGSRASFGPADPTVVMKRSGFGSDTAKVANDLELPVFPMKPSALTDSHDVRSVGPGVRAPLAPMTATPSAPTSCYDASPIAPPAGISPHLGKARCTSDEVTEVATRCLANPGDHDCVSYLEAHGSCSTCVMGAGPLDDAEKLALGVLYPTHHGQFAVNTASCAAIVLHHEECVKPLAVQEACIERACGRCGSPDTKGGCRLEASRPGGVCATSMDAQCTRIMEEGRPSWEAKCLGATREQTFTKVATLYCSK